MSEPILRATDATGEVYDDPSEDALYMFMEDLKSPGSSFRIERLEEGREGEWAQVATTTAVSTSSWPIGKRSAWPSRQRQGTFPHTGAVQIPDP